MGYWEDQMHLITSGNQQLKLVTQYCDIYFQFYGLAKVFFIDILPALFQLCNGYPDPGCECKQQHKQQQ